MLMDILSIHLIPQQDHHHTQLSRQDHRIYTSPHTERIPASHLHQDHHPLEPTRDFLPLQDLLLNRINMIQMDHHDIHDGVEAAEAK
jgi:hypothetical protein